MHGRLRTRPLFARTASLVVDIPQARLHACGGLDLGRSAEHKDQDAVSSCSLAVNPMAMRHLVHIYFLCVDARLVRASSRLIAPCPPSSLRAQLISISCFLMDRNERAVSEDDYHAAVTTGNNSPWPGVNLLEGLWAAGRKALTSLLEEVTDLPAKRATMAGNVFMHMWNLFREGHNAILLDIAIELDRESLALRPPGHRYRATSCVNLAVSLRERYEQTSDAALLDESIELEREALVLQPPGHSDRSTVCVNLALSLHVRYGQTGDAALLDEAIELAREALVLQPPGHPDRAGSFGNLAVFLCGCYQQTGDAALLDEAIELAREALVLQPPGHPDRAGSCGSLAASLRVRYRQTGDTALLDEAIKLDREALVLRPPGHHQRVRSCNNLAVSLYERCGLTGNAALLDEAIKLDRETLALRPLGHPDHASSCGSLAASLHKRYQQTGNAELLNEAIELHRKALALQPPGHPNRVIRCTTLAVALCARYKQTGDAVLLDEAIEACIHGLEHSLPSSSWCPLTQLSRMHLIRDSPHYSVSKALEYIQQSFQHEANSIHKFVPGICDTAALIWDNPGVWTPPITALLVDVYAKMVDRLPLVAGFVLDTPSRLQYLKPTRQIGSDAFVAALLAKQPVTALTLIDRAHGVVWSQALRQRDPQMEGAPASLSAELEGLLGAIATRAPVDPAPLPDQHSTEDIRHRQDTRIQIILRQIRAMPGLSHFMLGSTYETLREVARDHPVVVLVAARDHAFALIMSGAGENEPPHALDLTLTSDDLLSLRGSAEQAGLRSRADTRDGNTDARVRVQISKMNVNHQPLRVLADIWRKIVKPVIDHLQLEVCSDKSMHFPPVDASQTEGHWSIAAPSSLVC
jgi:hypothetical protein